VGAQPALPAQLRALAGFYLEAGAHGAEAAAEAVAEAAPAAETAAEAVHSGVLGFTWAASTRW